MKLCDADFRHTEPTWAKNERIQILLITGLGSKQSLSPLPLAIFEYYEIGIILFWFSEKQCTVEELKIKNNSLIWSF